MGRISTYFVGLDMALSKYREEQSTGDANYQAQNRYEQNGDKLAGSLPLYGALVSGYVILAVWTDERIIFKEVLGWSHGLGIAEDLRARCVGSRVYC